MRYKQLVLRKLETLSSGVDNLNSLLSQPNMTREQYNNWQQKMKGLIEETVTLINTEHESVDSNRVL